LFGPGNPGLPFGRGGVFAPLPFKEGRWLVEFDLPDEARVVGGDGFSNHELSVDELLFPLLVCCERCSSFPSLLEEEFWSEVRLLVLLVVLKEAFDRRRRLRSLRKEGIAVGVMSHFLPSMVGGRGGGGGVSGRPYCRRATVGLRCGSRGGQASASRYENCTRRLVKKGAAQGQAMEHM
jgi:hypothetical protein